MNEFLSLGNKFLTVLPGVVLTRAIDNVIAALDVHFESLPSDVTSGLRMPEDQLRIIINYAKKRGISVDFTQKDINSRDTSGQYVWQFVWSKLLDTGLLINPPIAAACLGTYKHGQIIQPSSHFRGTAFDIDGMDIDVKERVILMAMADGIPIYSYVIERENNCVHINVNL
jgi:hypothetical protein